MVDSRLPSGAREFPSGDVPLEPLRPSGDPPRPPSDPVIRRECAPVANETHEAREITAAEFDALVAQAPGSVVLEFGAPW